MLPFIGVGLAGGYSRLHADSFQGTSTLWTIGAYGETGATYMLTPHVGIGSRAYLTLSRSQGDESSANPFGGATKTQFVHYRAALSPVQLLAAVYF